MNSAGANRQYAEPDWPPVIIGSAFQTSVRLMCNFRRRRVRVSCFDSNLSQPGFRSVYGKAHHCPNPDEHLDEWLAFMVRLARDTGGKPVLIAASDQFVSAVAKCSDELEKHYRFARSTATVQALLATKRRQYELAALHGLGVPKTTYAASLDEVMAFAETARFPCLLKPDHFREWEGFPAGHPLYCLKVAVAETPAELASQYRLAEPRTPRLMVQEVIQGPDTSKLVYLACYAQSGERIGGCMLRELRTMPPHYGGASIVEPCSDPEVDAQCDRFLRALGYTGVCEIELKRDCRDGAPLMIETNPRVSGSGDAAPYAGVDLAWLHYLDLIGEKVDPVFPPPRDVRHIMLLLDFACHRIYVREGLTTWWEILRSYRPPVGFFDFDLRDYRVTARHCVQLLKSLGGPTYRRFFPKRKAR